MAVVSSEVSFLVHVQQRSQDRRTGVHSGVVPGWVWDRRTLETGHDPSTYYRDLLRWDGALEGFSVEDYRDGVVHGIAYQKIRQYPQGFERSWTPEVGTGFFTVGSGRLPLYSDYSSTVRLDPADTVDDLARIELPAEAAGPIFAAVYERDQYLRARPYRVWRLLDDDEAFTGYLDELTGERVDAEPADVPTFTEMDPNKFECRLDPSTNELLFNSPAVYQVGDLANTDQEALEALWEEHGQNSAGRVVYSKYFPIVGDAELVVFISDGLGGGTVQAYTEVTDFSNTTPADFHYMLDRDLGIFYLSGYEHTDEFLAEDIDAVATAIPLVLSQTVRAGGVPESGVVTIGGESIEYTLVDGNMLLGLTRSAPAAHTAGAVVDFQAQGDWAGSATSEAATVYIAYEYGPRVDFETTVHASRSSNYASWLDLHPLRRINSDGVLQLSSTVLNVDSLELTLDAQQLQGSSWYGPVFFGTGTTRATVTARDVAGNPVPDIDITLEILPDGDVDGVGRLNSSGKSVTGLSNLLGQIYALYSAPIRSEDTETVIDSTMITHDGLDTVVEVPFNSTFISLSNIWLFQVLKTDPFFGTTGFKVETFSIGTDSFGEYIEIPTQLSTDLYEGGSIFSYDVAGMTTYTGEILRIISEREWDSGASPKQWNNRTRVYVDVALPVAYHDDPVWFIPFDAPEWDSAALNGSRVLVYTEQAGPPTYLPLYPTSAADDGATVTYSNILLPLPDAEDRDNNVGAYVLVTNRIVRLQAHCLDPATGRRIESNVVTVLVELPASLIGDHQFEGSPSYGFRIVGDSSDASGLGGANYFTVNPLAQNINRLSLTANIP